MFSKFLHRLERPKRGCFEMQVETKNFRQEVVWKKRNKQMCSCLPVGDVINSVSLVSEIWMVCRREASPNFLHQVAVDVDMVLVDIAVAHFFRVRLPRILGNPA